MDMTTVLNLFVFGLSLIVFVTYLRKKFKSNSAPFLSDSQIQYLQNNWRQIRIVADKCDVLKANEIIDRKAVGEEEGLLELHRITIFPDEADWKTEEKTRILCRYEKLNEEVVFETVVGKESTAVQIKLHTQGYIDIYENPSNNKEYCFDLRFLDKPIEELR